MFDTDAVPDGFGLAKYCQSHVSVNVGMKSRPGISSSTKLNMLPNAPFQPLNMMKNIKAEIGAQMTSASSPMTGTEYVAYPIISIRIQAMSGGFFFITDKMCLCYQWLHLAKEHKTRSQSFFHKKTGPVHSPAKVTAFPFHSL